MNPIVSSQRLTENIVALEIEAPEITSIAKAGQIVMTRFDHEAKDLPRTITEIDVGKGSLTIVVRASRPDEGTAAAADPAPPTSPLTSPPDAESDTANADREMVEISGPFGQHKSIDGEGKILCVAEGMGIPAILPRLRELKNSGCYTMTIAGYPSKDELFWIDRMDQYSDELYIVTDDGSFGIKGPTRHTLRAVCDQVADIERVVVAGPLAFLKSAAEVTRKFEIATTVSLGAVLDGVDFPGPDDATSEATAESSEQTESTDTTVGFDWSKITDLDGHEVDFAELTQKLGFQISKK